MQMCSSGVDADKDFKRKIKRFKEMRIRILKEKYKGSKRF